MGASSSCLGIDSGVRDFRREAGAWNMDVVFTSIVQLARVIAALEKAQLRTYNGHQCVYMP